jgi:hypothetical protein
MVTIAVGAVTPAKILRRRRCGSARCGLAVGGTPGSRARTVPRERCYPFPVCATLAFAPIPTRLHYHARQRGSSRPCVTKRPCGARASTIDSSLVAVLNAVVARRRLAETDPANAPDAIAVEIAAVAGRALGDTTRRPATLPRFSVVLWHHERSAGARAVRPWRVSTATTRRDLSRSSTHGTGRAGQLLAFIV